jgi:hypothetical protein
LRRSVDIAKFVRLTDTLGIFKRTLTVLEHARLNGAPTTVKNIFASQGSHDTFVAYEPSLD